MQDHAIANVNGAVVQALASNLHQQSVAFLQSLVIL